MKVFICLMLNFLVLSTAYSQVPDPPTEDVLVACGAYGEDWSCDFDNSIVESCSHRGCDSAFDENAGTFVATEACPIWFAYSPVAPVGGTYKSIREGGDNIDDPPYQISEDLTSLVICQWVGTCDPACIPVIAGETVFRCASVPWMPIIPMGGVDYFLTNVECDFTLPLTP